jgi:CheY-like chemotaxis protein/HPt (histidine-containing phosphotransfer) domain-containing protein
VSVANNGREALAVMESHDFDLVLMDVQMPVMDGFEATAAIRARERRTGRHVPIIAMTAHALKGDRERCLEGGMDGYVAKPVHAEQLVAAINDARTAPRRDGTSLLDVKDTGQPAAKQVRGLDMEGALRFAGGDEQTLAVVIEAALQEGPDRLAEMRRAVEAGDGEALRRAAHALKGAVRCFGETPAFELAARIEQLADADRLDEAAASFAELDTAMQALSDALAEHLKTASDA